MCKKFIYVDTENTGYDFAEILKDLDKSYNLRLIYTQHNSKMSVSYLQDFMHTKAKVDFIETKNGNANALDFCLVADVCYTASMYKKAVHVIYSRDKGYYTAINYLRDRGIKVRAVENSKDIIDTALREEYDLAEFDYPDEFFDKTPEDLSISLSLEDTAFLKTKITKVLSKFGVGVSKKGDIDGGVLTQFMSCINHNKEIDFNKLKSELSRYSKFKNDGEGNKNLPLLSMQLESELKSRGFKLKAS